MPGAQRKSLAPHPQTLRAPGEPKAREGRRIRGAKYGPDGLWAMFDKDLCRTGWGPAALGLGIWSRGEQFLGFGLEGWPVSCPTKELLL